MATLSSRERRAATLTVSACRSNDRVRMFDKIRRIALDSSKFRSTLHSPSVAWFQECSHKLSLTTQRHVARERDAHTRSVAAGAKNENWTEETRERESQGELGRFCQAATRRSCWSYFPRIRTHSTDFRAIRREKGARGDRGTSKPRGSPCSIAPRTAAARPA